MSEEIKPDRWSQLSDEERSLILRRLNKSSDREKARAIPQRPDPETAPLSFSQEQLWFLDQFEPGVTAYIRPWVLRLRGPLEVPALEKSLAEIIRRHEALRTIFLSSEGQPYQRILPASPFNLHITDLRDEEDPDVRALEIAKQDANTPFDLLSDPLLRIQLIRITGENHLLLLTTHHIAFDGWSERILFKELSELYAPISSGKKPDLPPTSLQFPDFALWQRKSLRGEEFDRLVTYWQTELAGAPPLLRLRTDFDRPKTRSYSGDSVKTILSQELSTAIRSWCQAEGTTLFMTLLAAYNLVLMNNSDADDIVVGGTLSGRNDIQLQDAIGFFVNTLVLRTDLSGDPSFKELIERIRSTVLRALDYQDLPFEKLVEVLNPRRDLSYTPVVQNTLQLRNLPDRGPGIPGLITEEIDLGIQEALFDLSLRIEELPEGLDCRLVYNAKLFSQESARRMLDQFQAVLRSAIVDPEIKISKLRMLDSVQRTTLDRAYTDSLSLRDISSPIVDTRIQEKSNLTGTQLLVWAGQKFRPESLLYNLPYTFTILGLVDQVIFEKAFQTMLDNTDALRTVISEENGIPQQNALDEMSANLEILDFSDVPDPDAAAREWIDSKSTKVFTLSERLFDSALLRVASEKWIWFLHVHHIIVDNTGVQLIFNRLEEIYRDISEGSIPAEHRYPQFEDQITIEKELLSSPTRLAAHEYWLEKLATPSEPLRFFGDHKLKASTQVNRISQSLDLTTCEKLNHLAESKAFFQRSLNATLTNLFTGILFTFLYRTTNSNELSIAIPFHNRRTPESLSTIGLFMEVLPLRISIDEGETFSSLMEKVNHEAVETLHHRNFAIGNPFHHPIYEATLNFQIVAVRSFKGSSVEMDRIHTGHEEDTIGLQVRDYGSSGAFTLDFDFHSDIFSEEDQKRSVSYFKRILTSVIENPDQRLDRIELISNRERNTLLYEFNSTDTTYSIETTVINLFEKQVEETPEKIAVVFEDRSLSYRQLNSKANQVANKLQQMGLVPDDPVGVFLERSPEMIVGILAILKAGCGYLPLDPNHPRERLRYILGDSGTNVVLTQSTLRDRLPGRRLRTLNLDDWIEFKYENDFNLPLAAGPDDLAYVIYTSGSTGLPKGVMVEHHSLSNFNEWAGENWEIGPRDHVLQFTSISWDAHIEEIFPSLSRGATLVLRTESMIETIQTLFEAIDRENITVLDLPTAYWHEVVEAIDSQALRLPSSVRLVIIGGDTCQFFGPTTQHLWCYRVHLHHYPGRPVDKICTRNYYSPYWETNQ
jgi:non-ribosomal peptide synthetase component F